MGVSTEVSGYASIEFGITYGIYGCDCDSVVLRSCNHVFGAVFCFTTCGQLEIGINLRSLTLHIKLGLVIYSKYFHPLVVLNI